MLLPDLVARPHPLGHRIDLGWRVPQGAGVTGVRLVRREGTHPVDPDDGVTVVAEGADPVPTAARDENLHGERTYYYTLFPFTKTEAGTRLTPGPWSRTAATATARHDLGGLLYGLLPAIYRRYDAAALPAAFPLQRFLTLPGALLDQLHSRARIVEAALDLERVDGRLLPLLAEWIGWRTDHTQEVDRQRFEIRAAAALYQRLGAVPTTLATVGRVTGRRARLKEFVHNVARTNEPERLALWASVRKAGASTWSAPELASVAVAFDGRAAHVRDTDDADLFVFHTRRRHGWDIWAKRRVDGTWEDGAPLVDRAEDDQHPVVVRRGAQLWLFWDGPRPGERHRQIWFSVRVGQQWSPPAVVDAAPLTDRPTDRRNPAAVVDEDGGLWLFWREWSGTAWVLRVNRHHGGGWQLLPEPGTVTTDPAGVHDDLTALIHPVDGRIWLFWARRERPVADAPARWRIAFRVKPGTDPTADDWSDVQAVAPTAPTAHDREPAALPAGGGVELFWATTRGGGWSVVRAVLDGTTFARGDPEPIGDVAATRRAPLAAATADDATVMLVRSNAAVEHATTIDTRAAGTTTLRTGDTAKIALRGRFHDFGTYTYQAGTHRPGRAPDRTDRDRVARDTLGVFLRPAPPGGPPDDAALARLAGVLPDFLPVNVRAVLITEEGQG